MIIHGATINTRSFEAETGWTINSEGACKADTCIPLPFDHDGQTLPAKALAEAMHLPFVEAPELDIMAIDGNISMVMPPTSDAWLVLNVVEGHIYSTFPVTASHEKNTHTFQGRLNAATHRVVLEAHHGNVVLD